MFRLLFIAIVREYQYFKTYTALTYNFSILACGYDDDDDDDMIYLLTAIGLSPGGRSTVHIYTQIIQRTIQNKQYIEQQNNFGRVLAVPRLG